MSHLKRCFGCSEMIFPGEFTIKTKRAGVIHAKRSCILDAWYKLPEKKATPKPDPLLSEALDSLNDICHTCGKELTT